MGGKPQATAVGTKPPMGVATRVTGIRVEVGVMVGGTAVAVACGGGLLPPPPSFDLVAVGGIGVAGNGVEVLVITVKLGIPKTWLDFDCGLRKQVAIKPRTKIRVIIRRAIGFSLDNYW